MKEELKILMDLAVFGENGSRVVHEASREVHLLTKLTQSHSGWFGAFRVGTNPYTNHVAPCNSMTIPNKPEGMEAAAVALSGIEAR